MIHLRWLPAFVLAAGICTARSHSHVSDPPHDQPADTIPSSHTHTPVGPFSQAAETELAEESFLNSLQAGETEIPLTAFGEDFILDVQPKHPFGTEVLVQGVFAAGTVRGIRGSHVRITAVGTVVQGLIDFPPDHYGMQSINIRTTKADVVELHRQRAPLVANADGADTDADADADAEEGKGSRSRRTRRGLWQYSQQPRPTPSGGCGGGTFWPPPPPPYTSKTYKAPYTGKKFSSTKDTCTMFLDVDSSVVNKLGYMEAQTLALHTFAVIQDAFERNTDLGVKLVLKGFKMHTKTTFDSIPGTTDFGGTFANYKEFLRTADYTGKRKNICLNHAIVLKSGKPRCGNSFCGCNDRGPIAAGTLAPIYYAGHAHVAGETVAVHEPFALAAITVSSTCGTYENPKWGWGTYQSKISPTAEHKTIGAAVSAIGYYDLEKNCNVGAVAYATADFIYSLYPQWEITRIMMHEIGHQLGAHHDCMDQTKCGGDAEALVRHHEDCARGTLDHTVMSYGKGYMNMLTFSKCSVKDIHKYLTYFDTTYAQQTACFISSVEAAAVKQGVAVNTYASTANASSTPAGICTTLKIGFEDDSSFNFYFYEMANGFASWYSTSIELYMYRDAGANRWVISPYLGSCEYCLCSTAAVIYEGADVDGDTAADATNRVWTPFATHTGKSLLSVSCTAISVSTIPTLAQGNQQQTCLEPKTCSQLGWSSISKGVCGASDRNLGPDGTTKCFSTQNWQSARNKCTRAGARLCSAAELQSGAATGTGCDLDNALVWTSSWCGLGNKRYVLNGNGEGELQCKSSAEKSHHRYGLRCCSDVNFAATTEAPATTTTTMQNFNQKSCATLGWATSSANPAVCGESDKGFKVLDNSNKCFYEKAQPDANFHCSKMGARLCTLAEVSQGVGTKTGCMMDSLSVWTSTPCGNSKFWTAKFCEAGSTNWFQELAGVQRCTQCTNIEEMHAMRCCSDAYPTNSADQSKQAKYAYLVKAAKIGKSSGIGILLIAGAAGAAVLMVGVVVKLLMRRSMDEKPNAVPSTESEKEVEEEVMEEHDKTVDEIADEAENKNEEKNENGDEKDPLLALLSI